MLHFHDMSTRYFRAGVGTVIYNTKGEIAIFKRAQPPIGVWELQQGGIDLGEHPRQTLWRELHEEVGIINTDIEHITELPQWTVYERDDTSDTSNAIMGQAHRWFFLQLKDSVHIDLSTSLEDAASEFTWSTFEHLIEITGEHKKHVYQTLHAYFTKHLTN